MTRGEITTRVQNRADRHDSTTKGFIHKWINETVRIVEQTEPLSYTKKSQEATISANNGVFTLPTTLILHHPFTFLVKLAGVTPDTYKYLVKVQDETFVVDFPSPGTSGDMPEYYQLTGGADALSFKVTPVQNQETTLRLANGYFYTGDFTADEGGGEGDDEENWLTKYHPNLVIEGVCSMLFEHYGEPGKADRARGMYQAFMYGDPVQGVQGLIPAQKKMNKNSRLSRVRTLDDLPLNVAIKRKYRGF